jgi:hypothetical protein
MVEFNTDINIIGSVANLDLIFDIIINGEAYPKNSEGFALIRTEKSKSRILRGIKSAFQAFSTPDQEIFVNQILKNQFPTQFNFFFLFLQFSLSNSLFYEINRNVLIKSIRMGKVSLPTDQIVAFIHSLKETNTIVKSWSESTIKILARKYISLLRKLGFIKSGRRNELVYFMPSEEMVIAFIYFLKTIEPVSADIFKSKYIDFIFIELSSLLEMVKSLRMKEFLNITTTGESLVVDLKYNFPEVADALSERYKTKI